MPPASRPALRIAPDVATRCPLCVPRRRPGSSARQRSGVLPCNTALQTLSPYSAEPQARPTGRRARLPSPVRHRGGDGRPAVRLRRRHLRDTSARRRASSSRPPRRAWASMGDMAMGDPTATPAYKVPGADGGEGHLQAARHPPARHGRRQGHGLAGPGLQGHHGDGVPDRTEARATTTWPICTPSTARPPTEASTSSSTKGGAATPPNEVWLMFTADKSGMGMTTVNNAKQDRQGRRRPRRPPHGGNGQPDRMRRLRLLRAPAALLGCLGVLLLLGGAPAYAHTALKDATPAPGSTVGTGTSVLALTFAQLKPGTTPKISLVGPDGTAVPVGQPVVAGGSVACAAVAPLQAGVNTLTLHRHRHRRRHPDPRVPVRGRGRGRGRRRSGRLPGPEPAGTGDGPGRGRRRARGHDPGLGRGTALSAGGAAVAVLAGGGVLARRARRSAHGRRPAG